MTHRALLTFALLLSTSCTHAQLVAVGTTLGTCASTQAVSAVVAALPGVVAALDGGNVEGDLATVAATYGWDVVTCTVEKELSAMEAVASTATSGTVITAAGETVSLQVLARREAAGRHWLEQHAAFIQ